MEKLNPMNPVKQLDKEIEAATVQELKAALAKWKYSNRHASRINARIRKLEHVYSGPTETVDE